MAEDKTNAMRMLDRAKVSYQRYNYDAAKALNGLEVAETLGQNPAQVFKTLVTEAKSRQHYVFVIPVAEELDLKKAAVAVGEKAVDMLPQKGLLPLTGYVHGGCSPIGMKKMFGTVIDVTAQNFDSIIFSGGRIGCQVEVSLADLAKVITFKVADLVKMHNQNGAL
jgi:Cys-tRNA(Pro)/Cys-tRNA(Cys) deacylase